MWSSVPSQVEGACMQAQGCLEGNECQDCPEAPSRGESQRWLLFPVWLSGRGGVREVAVFSFYPLLPTAHVNKSLKRTGMSSISNMMFTSPYVQS